ncbi:lactonase family protein [Gordonia sihwensis]|uniref:lactonase family protein n=1 Tax=Gordonia TaxID=2053 RepID=UPI002417F09B|nr:beta-propeller fold lactonase family protein [Gordonia sihwensis]WFN93223.1 beta-propeller fold lactonase family protein [Gordonia sihwensis]
MAILPNGVRVRLTALLTGLVLLTAGVPGTAHAGTPHPRFLLTAGTASQGISVLRVHDDGALTPVPGSPFATGLGVLSLVVSPDGEKVYVPHALDGGVSGYRISASGRLTPIPGADVKVGGAPTAARLTPDGKYLYVVLGGVPGRVTSYRVTGSGALIATGKPTAPVDGFSMVGMGGIDPSGTRMRVVSYIGNTMTNYALGPGGGIRRLGVTRVGLGPVAPGYSPDGRFLYVSDEFSMGLSGFRIGDDGSVTPTPGSPYPTGGVPHGIVMTPDGKRLYVPNAVGTSIAAYNAHADGRLTPIAGSPYPGPAGTLPGQVLLHPNGRYLYDIDVLTARLTSRVTTYRIGADGSLSRTSRPEVDTGVIMSDGPIAAMTP